MDKVQQDNYSVIVLMGTQATMEGSLELDQYCASRVGLKWLCRTICNHAARTLSTARTFLHPRPLSTAPPLVHWGTFQYLITVSGKAKRSRGRRVLREKKGLFFKIEKEKKKKKKPSRRRVTTTLQRCVMVEGTLKRCGWLWRS